MLPRVYRTAALLKEAMDKVEVNEAASVSLPLEAVSHNGVSIGDAVAETLQHICLICPADYATRRDWKTTKTLLPAHNANIFLLSHLILRACYPSLAGTFSSNAVLMGWHKLCRKGYCAA